MTESRSDGAAAERDRKAAATAERIAGAILSVTVPATIIRSDCRGEAGSGMIPNRMKSYRGPEAAIISIAQQARPNW